MRTHDLTHKIIASMLKENTGVSFLDSGGTPRYDSQGNYIGSSSGYGRHYERNKNRIFERESSVSLSFRHGSIEYTKNLYHFLVQSLSYEKNLNNSLFAYERAHRTELEYTSWYEIFLKWLDHKGYTEGLRENTYNQENNLSQDFVFSLFSEYPDKNPDIYDTPFVALQIHNGCDARGGYTLPKIFSWDDSFLMWGDGYIFCEGENRHYWQTDDSYHWYCEGSSSGTQLQEYPTQELSEYMESEDWQELTQKTILVPEGQGYLFSDYTPTIINPAILPSGILFYNDDTREGLCPLCHAKLVGG